MKGSGVASRSRHWKPTSHCLGGGVVRVAFGAQPGPFTTSFPSYGHVVIFDNTCQEGSKSLCQ